jgi:thiol-disulfide isomerase/thioredoxin
MMNKLIFMFVLILILGGFIGSAKAFSFTDLNGKQQILSNYEGKWVLVNFWAPWCPRCKMDFPTLNDLDSLPNFVVIGVGMDFGVDSKSVTSTVSRYNIRFPTIMGTNRRDSLSPALQVGPVDYYPTSYLYNPKGDLVMFIPGIISKKKIMEFIK